MAWRLALPTALLLAGAFRSLPAQSTGKPDTLPLKPDTLPLRLRVTGSTVELSTGRLCQARAGREFRYTGGQRFILKSVADAEQHFFVSAGTDGTIRRLYWLQAEELLPGRLGGYDYTSDSLRTLDTLPWWVSLRAVTGPPQAGSDRDATVKYLTAHGFTFPALAPRLRLVHVPEPRGRREFMVIYLEAASLAGVDTSFDAVLARARQGLKFQACR